MTLQCLGWRHSGEDGRTGSEVMEETRFAGLTPRRHPGQAQGRWPYPLSRVLPSFFEGCDVEEVREWAAKCHGMTSAFPHNSRTAPRMAAQCGLVEQHRVMVPRKCQRADVVGIRL
jgi:hypothetical protein